MKTYLIHYASPGRGMCIDVQAATTLLDAMCKHKTYFPKGRVVQVVHLQ